LCRVAGVRVRHRHTRLERQCFRVRRRSPEPYPVAWQGDEIVWWNYPDSASIAAEGVSLFVGNRKVGAMLMYRDYVAKCVVNLAVADGGDRYATYRKRIVLAGRDLSHDRLMRPRSGSSLRTVLTN